MINYNTYTYKNGIRHSIDSLFEEFNHTKASKALEAHNYMTAILKLVHNILMAELEGLNEDNLFNRDNYREITDPSYIELGEYGHYDSKEKISPYKKISQYKMSKENLIIFLRYQDSTEIKDFSESNLKMIRKKLKEYNIDYTVKGDTIIIQYQYAPTKINSSLDDCFSIYLEKTEELRRKKIEKDEVLDSYGIRNRIITILNTLIAYETKEMAAIAPNEYKHTILRSLGNEKIQELPFNQIINYFSQKSTYSVDYSFKHVQTLSDYGIVISIKLKQFKDKENAEGLIADLNRILEKDSINIKLLNTDIDSREIRITYIYDKSKTESALFNNFNQFMTQLRLKEAMFLANNNAEKSNFHADITKLIKSQLEKFIKAIKNNEIDEFKSPNNNEGIYVMNIEGPRFSHLGDYTIKIHDVYSPHSHCEFDSNNRTLKIYLFYPPAAATKIYKTIDIDTKMYLEELGIIIDLNIFRENINKSNDISGGWLTINYSYQMTKTMLEPKEGISSSLNGPKG